MFRPMDVVVFFACFSFYWLKNVKATTLTKFKYVLPFPYLIVPFLLVIDTFPTYDCCIPNAYLVLGEFYFHFQLNINNILIKSILLFICMLASPQ